MKSTLWWFLSQEDTARRDKEELRVGCWLGVRMKGEGSVYADNPH